MRLIHISGKRPVASQPYGAHMRSEEVIIHGPDGFSGMRKAGRLAASVLDMITPHVVAGVTTQTFGPDLS